MSHFAVLVIGDNVEQQLQPFHEFECTGINDEHVQNVNLLDEAKAEYESDKSSKLKDLAGTLHDPWDDRFYRDPTPEEAKEIGPMGGSGIARGTIYSSRDWGDGQGYRPKVQFVPDGYEKVTVPTKEVQSFAEFVQDHHGKPLLAENDDPDLGDEHQYGWCRVNEAGEVIEIIDRTNPNKKWDWWVVGGRWTGFFRLKEGCSGQIGEPGLMTPEAKKGRADVARKDAVDFAGMKDEAGNKAAEKWDEVSDLVGGQWWESFPTIRDRHPDNIDAAREEYNGQPSIKKLRELHIWDLDKFLVPRDEFIQAARDSACVTYAVLKDGEWIGRGDMGWWGVSLNEGDKDDWNSKVEALIESLPDDTLLTVVDCHI